MHNCRKHIEIVFYLRIKIVVMKAKLTLKIDKSKIEKAKKYAMEKDSSLSKMIENYLQALTNKQEEDDEISPLVKSLTKIK